MKVSEVLKNAILFSGKVELLGLNVFNSESENLPTVEQQADIDLFVQCFNYVYKEIASQYYPILEKEEIKFINNQFEISKLTKKPILIKKIFRNNKKLKYYIYPDYIFCKTDFATIVYSSLPEDFEINQDVDLFSGRVIPQVMAYGVAREYAFISGNYSDADVWEARFKTALGASFSLRGMKPLPKRRFI